MLNKITDGISLAINYEFGDGYEIYTESVEQGLQEPCFSIVCLNPTIEQFFGDRYYRTNMFCIHYFPSSVEPTAECNTVFERLFRALEYITVDEDPVRGTNIHGEYADGMLHVYANYNMYVYKDTVREDSMENVAYNTGVKG